jgi:hypothetical protein
MSDTKTLLLIALVWALGAYLIVLRMWAFYFRRHPPLTKVARVTETGDGHPGDPVNIGLVGDEADLVRGMTAAGWFPANPITVESSVRIAADTVLRRSDDDAPVSNLFLFGRKQDFGLRAADARRSWQAASCSLLALGPIVRGPPCLVRRRNLRQKRGAKPHYRAGHPSHRA